jgi:hypothetical protein
VAIAVELNFPDTTLDQYDQVIAKMGFHAGGAGGPGSLFHWVMRTDDGIRVVDVWQSAEQFQRFADGQIAPITQEVGMKPPEVRMYEVHNYLTAG